MKDDILYNISNTIRTVKDKQKMSQSALARKSGIMQRQLCRYEHGEALPSLVTVVKLSLVLGVSIDELVDMKKLRSHVVL